MLDMTRKRADQDPVTTAYVAQLIHQWREDKRELKELAAKGRMAPSILTQIASGEMGVGARTLPRVAKAFGFPSGEALRLAALEAWVATRKEDNAPRAARTRFRVPDELDKMIAAAHTAYSDLTKVGWNVSAELILDPPTHAGREVRAAIATEARILEAGLDEDPDVAADPTDTRVLKLNHARGRRRKSIRPPK